MSETKLTKEDHAKRSKGIGSSEIAMLLTKELGNGKVVPLSPWGGPHKLWRRKTGREDWSPDSDAMRRGRFLEKAILEMYASTYGYRLESPPTKRHESYSYVVDSVDALAFKGPGEQHKRTVEAKTAVWVKQGEWGDEGTDQVPKYYIVQCQWHEGVWPSEDRICDVAVLLNGVEKYYHVAYDEDLYMALVCEAEKFWYDHVLKDKEPEIDGYPETSEWLQKRITHIEEGLVDADNEMSAIMLRYRELRLLQNEHKSEMSLLENKIKQAIGSQEGIVIPGTKQKITWKKAKESTGLMKIKMAEDYLDGLGEKEKQEAIEKYGVIKEGSRRFLTESLLKN